MTMAVAYALVTLCWLLIGAAGQFGGVRAFAPWALAAWSVGGTMVLLRLLALSYRASGHPWPAGDAQPHRLRLGATDYLKAAICWLHAFKRTYALAPGLYYTGEHYDQEAPLLVTSNYHLTVFLVLRHVQSLNVRLLVLDSDGINVWCAAGKGQFGNRALDEQLDRYPRELLTSDKWLPLVLPKFGMAGMNLRALRKQHIRPIIGPLYAKDLPAWLATGPRLSDCNDATVSFGLQMRTFSWLPGLVQAVGYGLTLALALILATAGGNASSPVAAVVIMAVIATAYPLLFPWLPGGRFAIKGLALAALLSLPMLLLWALGSITGASIAVAIPYTFASALFFGLFYTGNSAVSNYTRVRKEVAHFLPLDVALFATSLFAFIALGGLS